MAANGPSPLPRPAWIVCAFVAACFLPFMGKAYHIDEPLFLAPAWHILKDPLHPLDFIFNWYGSNVPMSGLNNTPPLTLYLLAAALKLTGGSEFWTRLCFLPVDLAGALGLYALAARFLKKPLLPVLVILASPAFVVGLNLLYPDKQGTALGMLGLACLAYGLDERRPGWVWAAAGLQAAAMLCKYSAVIFLAPAAALAFTRGFPPRRAAAWLALALTPLAAFLLADLIAQGGAVRTAWTTTLWGHAGEWSRWPHALRAFLAFIGGCGIATALWPLLAFRPRPAVLAAAAVATGVLFSPAFDADPVVWQDRVLGLVFGFGALLALGGLLGPAARKLRGWPIWAAWAAAAALLQGVYWSVIARVVFLLIPPLVLAMAESLERDRTESFRRRLYAGTLALSTALSLCLGWADYRFAGAQRDFVRDASARYAGGGRNLWFTGHWGFQYYWERAGARPLDAALGGWSQVRPGDTVFMSLVNANLEPPPDLKARRAGRLIECAVPLRLMSAWSGAAGFYSSALGFLPFAVSREPLDQFIAFDAL